MTVRGAAVLGVLIACSGDGGGKPTPGVRIQVESRDDHGKPAWYLAVRYRYQPPADAADDLRLQVRAACQVGALRLVDDSPEYPSSRPGSRGARGGWHTATPFILNELPAKPSLCELAIGEVPRYDATPRPLYQVCARLGQAPVDGRCPPNPVDGDGTGAGWSVAAFDIEHRDPDPDGIYLNGEQLVLSYTLQAHHDQPPDTWMHVTIACADGASDDASHSEAGAVRAGEAFKAAQIKLNGRVPAPATPCTVTFAAQAGLGGTETTVDTYCYRDRALVHAGCD